MLRRVALALALLGCSRKDDPRSSPVDAAPYVDWRLETHDANAHIAPLTPDSPYCAGTPCRTYEQSVQRVRELAARDGGRTCFIATTLRRCIDEDGLRIVGFSDGSGGFEEYFNAEGKMVCARVSVVYDLNPVTYGTFPSCPTVARGDDLCEVYRDAGVPEPPFKIR